MYILIHQDHRNHISPKGDPSLQDHDGYSVLAPPDPLSFDLQELYQKFLLRADSVLLWVNGKLHRTEGQEQNVV